MVFFSYIYIKALKLLTNYNPITRCERIKRVETIHCKYADIQFYIHNHPPPMKTSAFILSSQFRI